MTKDTMSPGREKMAELARRADRVSTLILRKDYPDIDVVIAIENLREEAAWMFPGSEELFEMLYVSRFRRLWRQWRSPEEPPF